MTPPVSRFSRLSNDFLLPALTAAVIISLAVVAMGSLNTLRISQGFRDGITRDFQMERLSSEIVHVDEVLTMSARMAAATGDVSWQERYEAYKPILVKAVEEAISLRPDTYAPYASQIQEAGQKLMEMDSQALSLVKRSAPDRALAVLFSDTYKAQKEIYASGIRQWSGALTQISQSNLNRYGQGLFESGVFSMVGFWVLMLAWATVLSMVRRYVRLRKAAEKRLRRAKGQLEQNHQELQVSQAGLLQKAATLEEILAELQQTERDLEISHTELQVSKAALEQKAATLEEILGELQLTQVQMVQSEKMSSLGQLVAGVAHEINNPVNFIYANLEPIGEYVSDLLGVVAAYQVHYPDPPTDVVAEVEAADLNFVKEDLPKILTSMEVGAERIRQIVLSLRNFSRSDEKGLKPVDVHEGLESTLVIMEHRLKKTANQSAIKVVRDYDTLPLVECLPGLLNQVFMNLLSNAIDAIDELSAQRGDLTRGTITIRTSTFMEAEDIEWVKIEIADTGIGILEEIQGRVFDAFFTTKPVGKGTGIGLSISYNIVTKKHNGRLTFTSMPRQGAEFVVQIPVSAMPSPHPESEFVLQPPMPLKGTTQQEPIGAVS